MVKGHLLRIIGCYFCFGVLSAGSASESECEENDYVCDEWSVCLEELGVSKNIKKYVENLSGINMSRTNDDMVKVAARFMKDVNNKMGTSISVDDCFNEMARVMKENKIRPNTPGLDRLRKALTKEYKRLGVYTDDEVYPLMVGDWDTMNRKECVLFTKVFCGCLLLFIPVPTIRATGASVIAEAIGEFVYN